MPSVAAPEPATPAVSVVIPIRDGAELVTSTLPSLLRQDVDRPYEVVVVDNGSRDATRALLAEAAGTSSRLRIVDEARPGCGRARHAGVAASRGSLLLFVDADMEAVPGLVRAHLEAHEGLDSGCVIGNIRSAPRKHPFERMLAYIYDGPRESLASRPLEYGDCWPGNMSLPRDLYDRLGGFDDRYADLGGEEWDFSQRLAQAAVPLRYAPAALTHHHFTGRFGPRLKRAYVNGAVYGFVQEQYPSFQTGGFSPVRHPPLARLQEIGCHLAARVLEPFDRGTGVPWAPLAFVYDRGLRMAAGRGLTDYRAGRVDPFGREAGGARRS